MNGISEERLKEMIGRAFDGPQVPQTLVERNVERAKAITEGRKAENELSVLGADTPRETTVGLAAKVVVGRLMLKQLPPANVKAEDLVRQVSDYGAFREAASGTPEKVLNSIRNGELFGHLRRSAGKAGPETSAAEKEIKAPEVEAPVVQTPGRQL